MNSFYPSFKRALFCNIRHIFIRLFVSRSILERAITIAKLADKELYSRNADIRFICQTSDSLNEKGWEGERRESRRLPNVARCSAISPLSRLFTDTVIKCSMKSHEFHVITF